MPYFRTEIVASPKQGVTKDDLLGNACVVVERGVDYASSKRLPGGLVSVVVAFPADDLADAERISADVLRSVQEGSLYAEQPRPSRKTRAAR